MPLQNITEQIRRKMESAPGLSARVKFDFEEEGVVFVDTTVQPPVVSHDDAEADVTFVCSIETFAAILNGAKDPNIAFMMGQLKIKGSMGLALKLNAILED